MTNLDAKGAKRSVKMQTTNYYKRFSKKYFVVHEQSAVENSFSKYIFYAPDGLFWLNLYTEIFHSKWICNTCRQSMLILHRRPSISCSDFHFRYINKVMAITRKKRPGKKWYFIRLLSV